MSAYTIATPERRVQDTRPTFGLRTNENHHLWNNNGTWFIHYTVYPTPVTKERIRRSLGTRDLEVARTRRDSILAGAG